VYSKTGISSRLRSFWSQRLGLYAVLVSVCVGCNVGKFVGQPEDGHGPSLQVAEDSCVAASVVGARAGIVIVALQGTHVQVEVLGGALLVNGTGTQADEACYRVSARANGIVPQPLRVALIDTQQQAVDIVVTLIEADSSAAGPNIASTSDGGVWQTCPIGTVLDTRLLRIRVSDTQPDTCTYPNGSAGNTPTSTGGSSAQGGQTSVGGSSSVDGGAQ
jgi:hypothetical protein